MSNHITIQGSPAYGVVWENFVRSAPEPVVYLPGEDHVLRYLPAGASHTMRFEAGPGPITCQAYASEAQGVSGALDDNFQDPGPPVQIDILAPDGHRVSSAIVPDEPPPEATAGAPTGGEWQVVFTNLHDANVRVSMSVNYTSMDGRELHATLLPTRVLEHAAAGAIAGAGLVVHLDGNYSYIDFSNDLKAASGWQLERAYFSVRDEVHDINLESLTVTVPPDLDVVTLLVEMNFETEGLELQSIWGVGDLFEIAGTVELRLYMDGPVGDRELNVWPIVSVNLSGVLVGEVLTWVTDIDEIEEDVRAKAQEEIDKAVYTSAVATYLGQVLLELAQRGDVLHDVRLSAHPEYPGIVVYHHAAETPAYPRPPVLPRPLPRPIPAALDDGGLANLTKFDHLVVLMQENRSFDQMLGWLQMRGRLDVDGLSGGEWNTAEGLGRIAVNRLPRTAFRPSPAHDVDAVVGQINNGRMDGFVSSFVAVHPNEDPALIMGFYPPNLLETFEFLTNNFLVCDRWFCSFPGATQPNRFCTLGGYTPTLHNLSVDDPSLGYLDQHTIFDELTEAGVKWVYYEHDVAFLRMFDKYRLDATRIVPINDEVDGLFVRLQSGTLPPVTFIDPDFVDSPAGLRATDDHPPADVAYGQEMIRELYNALFASSLADRILFVVTYDEHGGFYDHVPPPGTEIANRPVQLGQSPGESGAASPARARPLAGGRPISRGRSPAVARRGSLPDVNATGWSPPAVHPDGPDFYGPRVPALVISAYVEPETCNHVVFDFTSLLRTIALKWLGGDSLRLGPRTVRANHLGTLLTRTTPRLNLPSMNKPARLADRRSAPRVRAEDLDEFHEAMGRFGKPPKARVFRRPHIRSRAAERVPAPAVGPTEAEVAGAIELVAAPEAPRAGERFADPRADMDAPTAAVEDYVDRPPADDEDDERAAPVHERGEELPE